MRKACGFHQIRQADTIEPMLTEQATGCVYDAVTVIGDLFFGQFHFSIRKNQQGNLTLK